MHGGSWCSFAYTVAPGRGGYTYSAAAGSGGTGSFGFSGGGQQCNRAEGSHGWVPVPHTHTQIW
jgi:hypothetical protein